MCPIFLPGGLDVRRSKTVDSVLRASRLYPARFASSCAACVAMRASSFRCAAVLRLRVEQGERHVEVVLGQHFDLVVSVSAAPRRHFKFLLWGLRYDRVRIFP